MNTVTTDDSVSGDAELWTIVLSSPACTDAERAEFDAWLAASSEHPAAYARAQRTHTLTRELLGDDLLMAELRRARRAAPAFRPLLRWASAGLAAALVIAIAVPAWQWLGRSSAPPPQRYVANVGEQRTLTLADGTQLVLDTHSEVVAHFDARERRIEFVQGQAQFVVAEDAQRPFVVVSGTARIRDIGTTFQVRTIGRKLSVTLLDGIVSVETERAGTSPATVTLQPGQKLTYVSGAPPVISRIELDHAQAWTQGSLFVQGQRLDQLLEEMNRYSTRQVVLADPADGAILISGKYKVDDQQALLKALQAGWSLHPVNTSPTEVTLKR
jgi:transmembrane sensor